jgi:hypothetical protein
MAYGEHLFDFLKRAAVYVDRIFKGSNPGELPIEQPTRSTRPSPVTQAATEPLSGSTLRA